MSELHANIYITPRTVIETVDRPVESHRPERIVLLRLGNLDIGFIGSPDSDQATLDAIDNLRGALAELRAAALDRVLSAEKVPA